MTALDAALGVAVVLAVLGGARMGFLRRSLSWLGLVGGLVAGAWIVGRYVRPDTSTGGPGVREFLISVGIVLLASALGQAAGMAVGAHARQGVGRAGGRVDSAAGAAIGLVGLVLAAWVILPAMTDVEGWPAREARSSWAARWIHDHLGDPPAPLDNLPKALGVDGLPRVFENLREAPSVEPPPAGLTLSSEALATAEASVFRVVGSGCGDRLQTGSSWVVATDVVVTNAHVVAGATTFRVERPDGVGRDAEVIGFDPSRDVAVLRVAGLGAAPLGIGDATEGTTGAVIGFPGGGPLTVANARVDRTVDAVGRDIYDRNPVTRRVHILGAALRPGDSGGPMVDAAGKVVAMAFAIAPDQPTVAYALAMSEVDPVVEAASGRQAPVGTGACAA